ncbi:SPFH domain-containing protein [Calycomorphotria hydatis]|uniref:Modulator of FtsH protease HflK n=1 Tax=Calycomorphotria hydatis TaxID=2528027 RepID=A0A517TA03_9PLAN|nr:SPFH domain-containing protein [Calycomorphotria hydatis]QDT65212.1 Modulator of FtsH protease HflK [Calycomorphotria hydatis]
MSKTPERKSDSSTAFSLLRNALSLVIVAMVAAFGYAFQCESGLFRAVGLELCLTAIVIWAAIDAQKARQRFTLVKAEPEEIREASALHYLFVAAPTVAVLVFTLLALLTQMVEVSRERLREEIIGGAIAAVLAASLWTIFSRSLPKKPEQEFTELADVRTAFSESRLTALLTGVTLLIASVYPPVESWAAWGLLCWILAVASEQLLRVLAGWFHTAPETELVLVAPTYSVLRDVFLSTTNPVGALFDIAEEKYGLSLRSSWTIRFFRRSVLPITIGCLLVVWGSTCFVVIEPQQAGVRERFGYAEKVKLEPGLHGKLPWPCGVIRRFPAQVVQTMQIGFSETTDDADVSRDHNRALLWTKPHEQEFSLVLGSETELIAINAIVYFQIANDQDRFLNYVYSTSNPEAALEAFAYRVLMEETRTATMAELLTKSRQEFSRRVQERLQLYSRANNLGLDVIDVALINLHPPVQVAGNYLDVINAELDSATTVTTAEGDSDQAVLVAETESHSLEAVAEVEAARRVANAGRESAEFIAIGNAFAAAPQTYRLRLWFEAFEKVLTGRKLFLIDADLPNVIFDERRDNNASLTVPNTIDESLSQSTSDSNPLK